MSNLVGQTLGRYKITSLLGQGGMGAVYKARDDTLKRDVAIKVMSPQFARMTSFQERFLQEARTVARISHPGVVQVYDFGQEEGQLFIVMEFIPGKNLSQAMEELRSRNAWFTLSEAVEIIRQVALAVHYAHNQGVLHRDLKPDNIMLRPEPSEGLPYRPVITDLGLAKLSGGDVETAVGTTMGTPAYMSPEQALGKTVDSASDVYSLGILLFELCTGRQPFPVKNLTEALKAHTQQPPPNPRDLNPQIPESLQKIILKCLEKDPSQRFPDAAALAHALETALPAATRIGVAPSAPAASVGTQVDEAPGRRAAPHAGAFGASPDASQDQIQVLQEDGSARFFPAAKPGGVTIGRGADNDIVLNDAQASRKHARIEFDGQVYRIIDLNSRNGTFLEDAKLLPGIAEPWLPEKALRIGNTWLRLALAQSDRTAFVSAEKLPKVEPPAGRSAGQGRVEILLDRDQITVEPGQMATLSVTLLNQGSLVDHFTASIVGIPAEWITNRPPTVQLMPGGQQVVTFTISPPRLPASRAGSYPIQVKVVSRDAPDRAVEARAVLTVTPFYRFSSELFPQKIRAGRPARVKLLNLGNAQDVFNLEWQDRAVEVDFKPPQASVKVAEGQEAYAEFRAIPRSRPWFGADRVHSFTAEVVSATSGETQTHAGEVVSSPVIPWWLILVVILLCLCLVAAAGLWYVNMNNVRATENAFNATQTAISATATAMADSDGDGLLNVEEVGLGTDPFKADTDGDGLTDGEEVKVYGTDPKKQDTDGDTLLDGVEVKELGTSPINQDTDGDGIKDNIDTDPGKLPTPTNTPTVTPIPTRQPAQICENTYPTRLQVGDRGAVSLEPPIRNNVRKDPGLDAELVGKLNPGEPFVIIGGPECKDEMVWWKVRSLTTNTTGWTSEGQAGEYWLVPTPGAP